MPYIDRPKPRREMPGNDSEQRAPRPGNKTWALGGGALLLMVGTSFLGSRLSEGDDPGPVDSQEMQEQEAIEQVEHAWNMVVALPAGTRYRTGPSDTSRLAGRVGRDEVLRLDRPLLYRESANSTQWLGFTPSSAKRDCASCPEAVFWAAFEPSSTPPAVYRYPSSVPDQHILDVSIDDHEGFMGSIGQKGGPIATASAIPQAVFYDEMVPSEGLIYNSAK